VDGAKALPTPPKRIVFDVTNHPTRLHVIEVLRGKAGYLTLTRLTIDSYEREEYLLFSGFDEGGGSLDQETMEKLFGCAGRSHGGSEATADLGDTASRRRSPPRQATISPLEQPARTSTEAREAKDRRHGASAEGTQDARNRSSASSGAGAVCFGWHEIRRSEFERQQRRADKSSGEDRSWKAHQLIDLLGAGSRNEPREILHHSLAVSTAQAITKDRMELMSQGREAENC
jgi:hypothetical protein